MTDRNKDHDQKPERIEKKDSGRAQEPGQRNDDTVSFDRPTPRERDKK